MMRRVEVYISFAEFSQGFIDLSLLTIKILGNRDLNYEDLVSFVVAIQQIEPFTFHYELLSGLSASRYLQSLLGSLDSLH